MQIHIADFPYYTFSNLARFDGIRHFVTSCRHGDDTDVNLRMPKGADNRRRLAKSVGFDIDRLVTGEQTHSLNIATVTESNAGMGNLDIDSRIPCTDGLITNVPDICLMVLTADCVPIIVYDPATHSCGAIHAGWRGTANGIAKVAIERMSAEFGTKAENIVASIGPCIGTCCFEVGEDVARHFARHPETIVRKTEWDRPHIDLTLSNRLQLIDAGVKCDNIEIAQACTKCNPAEFFSHRHNQTLGRIGTGIMLKKRLSD